MMEWRMDVRRLVGEMLLIALCGCVLGAAANFPLVRRFLAGEFRQAFIDEEKYPGLRFITLGEAVDLFQAGEALFIDSRARQDFAIGRIPGALSIPLEEIKAGGASGKGRTEEILSRELFSFPPDRILVVYCEGGDCQTSLALARLIHDLGFRDIRVFEGGWAEWAASGLPAEESR